MLNTDSQFDLRPKQPGEGGGGDDPSEKGQDDELVAEEHAIICKQCSTEVSARRFVFTMRSGSAAQVFPNPYGQMKEIITVRSAWSVQLEGWATEEFTWFHGYAWRVAYCAECRAHLGWRFEAEDSPDGPARFFGLLAAAIVDT